MNTARTSLTHHGIDVQVDHIADFVEAESSRYARVNESESGSTVAENEERTIVIGHSIGCYLGIEAMRRSPSSVYAFIGIMVGMRNVFMTQDNA